jgi:glycolate oxidase
MNYKQVTREDIEFFSSVCSPARVVEAQNINHDYGHDEMPIYGSFMPEVLIYAQSVGEISKIMAHCNQRRIPVTPRGAGTGLCGGAVATQGGVLLSTEKMNRILEVDQENFTATVEPGVLLMDFSAHVLEKGLFYPPEPGEKSATLGGNVMTNAGGMKAVKYGVTRDYVMGLEVVLPDGEILTLGGKIAKNSSGYSLLNLFIGSEGTLGIVTKIVLRLLSKPSSSISLLVPFESIEQCIAAVPLILKSSLSPVAVEFMQKEVILEAEKYLGTEFPDKSSEAYLLLSFDGSGRGEVEALCDRAAGLCLEAGARDAFYADTGERISGLWSARGAFLEAIKSSTTEMDECDVVVPRNRIADFINYVDSLEKTHGLRMRHFGHAGDGNIHIYLCRDDLGQEEWTQKLETIMQKLYDKAVELEGKVSGEHGVGHAKLDFLRQSEGALFMDLSAKIKKAFDANLILNPGKVVEI